MSRRGREQKKQTHQVQHYDPFGNPFGHMRQIMKSFGGFENDPFFNRPFSLGHFDNPSQEMFKFSDVHKNMHEKGAQGSYVCQTYVSSSTMGEDGKIKKQDYFQNQIGQHGKGNTISQKHQAYKNNEGVNRIAEERMLNDQGRKMVREKRGNNIEETNHYYNIEEQDEQRFNSNWRQADGKMRFLENHNKHLRSLDTRNPRGLGYEPSRPEQRVRKLERPDSNSQKQKY